MSACLREAEPETGNAMDGPNVGDVVLLVNSEEHSEYSTVLYQSSNLTSSLFCMTDTAVFSVKLCLGVVTRDCSSSVFESTTPPLPSPPVLDCWFV